MATLHHYPLCPHSRFIRLVLGEFGMETDLVEERVWERRREFLELNTAGTTPVFREESGLAVPGAGPIAEYLDETRGLALGRTPAAAGGAGRARRGAPPARLVQPEVRRRDHRARWCSKR